MKSVILCLILVLFASVSNAKVEVLEEGQYGQNYYAILCIDGYKWIWNKGWSSSSPTLTQMFEEIASKSSPCPCDKK